MAVLGTLLTLLVPVARRRRDLHPTLIEPTRPVAGPGSPDPVKVEA
jgi:hypothetical protein